MKRYKNGVRLIIYIYECTKFLSALYTMIHREIQLLLIDFKLEVHNL